MQKITSALTLPLHDVAATRQVEQQAAAALQAHALMQRAGLAVARLALALVPHAGRIWVVCGPGNNGGDGFEAARLLHQWGKDVVITWTGLPGGRASPPPDAHASREAALRLGVPMASEPPEDFDLCIDALLGIGGKLDPAREGTALMQQWLQRMRDSGSPRLAVDLPSGLDADTGVSSDRCSGMPSSRSNHRSSSIHTLSLLTLKPGLFTASGRDECGEIWFDDLAVDASALCPPSAWLMGANSASTPGKRQAAHASHKGSFGDVAVIGGESGHAAHMAGAALLAGRAALHAGAGRVFVALLGNAPLTVDTQQPELMFRSPEALDLKQVVVCGCGGGEAVKTVLPRVLSLSRHLVLDADALNAIANDTQLQTLLTARSGRGYGTVLTPHPLEAARLLQSTAAQVQADRRASAHQLAQKFHCVVVLKGSGTIVTAPDQAAFINSSGNALLATAGTGDVLAGMLGAHIAGGMPEFAAACSAVFAHGQFADDWARRNPEKPFNASTLARMGAI